jgi:hypothetical protein
MRPAICVVCGRGPEDEPENNRGGYLHFAEYRPPEYLDPRYPPPGHPAGLEYLCHEHFTAASTLTSKTSDEAAKELQAQFGLPPLAQHPRPRFMAWLERLFFPIRR